MEFKLKYLGDDDWNRPVYKDQKGRIWKDINCGRRAPEYCTSVGNKFLGEPCDPMDVIYPGCIVTILNDDKTE